MLTTTKTQWQPRGRFAEKGGRLAKQDALWGVLLQRWRLRERLASMGARDWEIKKVLAQFKATRWVRRLSQEGGAYRDIDSIVRALLAQSLSYLRDESRQDDALASAEAD